LKTSLTAVVLVASVALVACGTALKQSSPSAVTSAPGKSGFYKDDGPGDAMPSATLDAIPDAVPRAEVLHRFANRPYMVFGREYVPATNLRPYKERGTASWYGRKFHGEKTAIGDTYDMYAMTAAHPTLPLPSYARVTSVATGKSVIVRVNDRGPFLHGRVIDLSYAACAPDRHCAKGQRRRRSRGYPAGRNVGERCRTAAAGRHTIGFAAGADRANTGAACRRRVRRATRRIRRATPMRKIFSSTCRTNSRRQGSNRRFDRATVCSGSTLGPMPIAMKHGGLRSASRQHSDSRQRLHRIDPGRFRVCKEPDPYAAFVIIAWR
jgi:hypothetical protein